MIFFFCLCWSVAQPMVFHTWLDSIGDLEFLWQDTDRVNRNVL